MSGKHHATTGFLPSTLARPRRRAEAKAARQILTQAARAERDAQRVKGKALTAERKTAQYMPAGGLPGPEAGRARKALKVPAHRATSDVLGGAYPFLAEEGLGDQGTFIGEDVWSGSGFCFDPWVLYNQTPRRVTNPNILLAGVLGVGKSSLAKCIATRSIAFGRKVYVPGDPKGEWSVVARAVGGQSIQLGGGSTNRLNPLDSGPRPRGLSEQEWDQMVTARRRDLLGSLTASALERGMRATEHTALGQALRTAAAAADEPTLPMVVDAMFAPTLPCPGATVDELREFGQEAAHALWRLVDGDLAGLFDGPSTVVFDATLPMVVLDLSKIQGNDQLIAMVTTCAAAWMEAALSDPDAGLRWVIYDEAWRLIKQPALLARMESQWKLSRSLGIANLMIIHRLSDLDAVGDRGSGARNQALGLLRDCGTKILYQQDSSEAPDAAEALGLSVTERDELPALVSGEGLWRVGLRSFIVRHLRTPAEVALTDTDSRMAEVQS